MSDSDRFSPDGKDRDAWERAWSGSPQRMMATLPRIEILGKSLRRFGNPSRILLTQDPAEFAGKVWREFAFCPICGANTSPSDRIPGSLHPSWERESESEGEAKRFQIGIGVWFHLACFESCPKVKGPAPIPW